MSALSYPEAVVIGALQGVTELFPVSSLGHSVLIPAIIGGRWARDLSVSTPESPYLAFIVGLHVATALALLLLFRRDWIRIAGGFLTSIRRRSITTADERLAWLVVLGTIPVGLTGLLLEHTFRTTLGKPTPAAIFLTLNGVLMLLGERLRRREPERDHRDADAGTQAGTHAGTHAGTQAGTQAVARAEAGAGSSPASSRHSSVTPAVRSRSRPQPPGLTGPPSPAEADVDGRIAALSWRQVLVTGSAQSLALLPGISRSGITMIAGLAQGLTHEAAVRLSFLLATPVILAAGVLKVPDLAGPLGAGIHGQILAGSAAAFGCAYVAARFLTRWFTTRTLTPFAVYCLVAGPIALVLVNR
jgi:undecaprenyl-diphosphatase